MATFGIPGSSWTWGWWWYCVDDFFLTPPGSASHYIDCHALLTDLQVHSTSKFTSTITICNVLHLYTCSSFSVTTRTGFTQLLVLHSFCDWLIGHWWVVHSPGATWFQWNYTFFPCIYCTHLAVFNFSPVIDYLRNTYQRMLKVAGAFKLLKPFPLQ